LAGAWVEVRNWVLVLGNNLVYLVPYSWDLAQELYTVVLLVFVVEVCMLLLLLEMACIELLLEVAVYMLLWLVLEAYMQAALMEAAVYMWVFLGSFALAEEHMKGAPLLVEVCAPHG
jgi:hypothetical protein